MDSFSKYFVLNTDDPQGSGDLKGVSHNFQGLGDYKGLKDKVYLYNSLFLIQMTPRVQVVMRVTWELMGDASIFLIQVTLRVEVTMRV